MSKVTPMMKQYMDLKDRYSGCILFFRLGDFYEMFFEDALLASRELEIALTGRDCGLDEKAPMCGVPYHSAENYIARLVERGHKVAICEQVEDASKAKGLVKRDVVKIITSGTITDVDKLDEKRNNYLLSLYADSRGVGITYVDITTGEIYTTEVLRGDGLAQKVTDEIGKIAPKEIVMDMNFTSDVAVSIRDRFSASINEVESWYFDLELASKNVLAQFNVHSLSGLGLEEKKNATLSTGALLEYLRTTQKRELDHIRNLEVYSVDSFMILDISTRTNLELTETIRGKKKKGSLLSIIDKTSTAMGGRLLKKWIEEPLIDRASIQARLDVVESFADKLMVMEEVSEGLKGVYDIERLVGKLVYGNCNGKDLIALKSSISKLPHIKDILMGSGDYVLVGLVKDMDLLEDVYDLIDNSIEEDPPMTITEGNLIKGSFNRELGELRDISLNGKSYLAKIESREREKTGIKNLKIKYNKVFGYFIELSKSNIEKAPKEYLRKQTLANAERYITEELKEIEDRILGSQDKMISLEYELFNQIKDDLKSKSDRLQLVAKIISRIDVLNSLAKASYVNGYVKPSIIADGSTAIVGGRHPVVEKMIKDGMFVSNDTHLDEDENRVMIITGPNMSGKSTYMRQVAIINLLAQIGSFVPAQKAEISIVDRIFTRIGASDDLAEGQSTFMVEMSEVANILNNATENSLIILDEIGRGTSTYDGLSIAWAVIEYISDKTTLGAKTLFATHYHELTELEEIHRGVKNYRVRVEEKEGDDIVFLRKIERGGADRSYGIEVARLAGVKRKVVDRAYSILSSLEEADVNKTSKTQLFSPENSPENSCDISETREASNSIDYDKSLFDSGSMDEYRDIVDIIRDLDMMKVTPIDAVNTLYSLWEKAKNIKE